MKLIGAVEQYPALQAIYEALTSGKRGDEIDVGLPTKLRVGFFNHSQCRYVDMGAHRYVEQNKSTRSQYAARARKGAKIVWVIRLRDNRYMGCIEDGSIFEK